MADRLFPKVIDLYQSYATDLPSQQREISYLPHAENVIFEQSRAIRKVGGGTRLNGTALTGGPSVLGQFDYWRQGTSGSPAQRFVVTTSDSKIYSEDPGTPGTFSDVTGAATIGANAIPNMCVARDVLVFTWSDASTPLQFNQTAVSTLTNAPSGRCVCYHAGRLWIGGTNANPSRVSYSSYTSITDWTGVDTGSIEQAFNPDDGDRIIGLASHKGVLIVFKGPNVGSIYIVHGTDPETFAVQPLVTGIPLQTPNSIVAVGDDLWWMSERGIHSLSATERYGNFEEAMLTRYLMKHFRDNINRSRLSSVWGVNYALKGMALWTTTKSGSSANDQAFCLSYTRAQEEGLKASVWNFSCQSAGIRNNPSGKIKEVLFGDNAGFLVRMDQSSRVMPNTTAYTARVTTPSLIIADTDAQGKPRVDQPTTLQNVWLRTQPVGDHDIVVAVGRDANAQETYTFEQGAAGFLLDTDVLDVDTLNEPSMIMQAEDVLGECRAAYFDITQGGANEDMHLFELGIEHVPAAQNPSSSLTS